MKNITTPRTLSECNFTTGYPLAAKDRPGPRWEWWLYAAAIAASVAFFWIRGY